MTAYRKILYQAELGLARITLNRPEKRNALDGELIGELGEALARAAADDQVRVVVLAGAGADFCSGADLEAVRRSTERGPLENMDDARRMADVFLQMRRHPRPIVAAVRGRALAGGCGLATACDMILSAESAQFGYPEVNVGFLPAMVMAILRRSVGEKRAFELITGGKAITARAALEAGLVNCVFADAEFDAEVERFARELAAKSASALRMAKGLLYHMDGMSFEAALEAGVQANAIARMTPDCRQGVERFLKKSQG